MRGRISSGRHRGLRSDERGQIALLGSVLIALLMGLVVAVAIIGQAMIERSNATIAADSVALAMVADPAAGRHVADWYRSRGFSVESSAGRAAVAGDQAQARSYAHGESELRVAPALVAVIARAEQLVAHTFAPVRLEDTRVVLTPGDSAAFDSVAAELGMCRSDRAHELVGGVTYQLC